jgi:hypothetical protein
MAWSVGELYQCVADEAMIPEVIEKYNAKTTGGKFILNPNKGSVYDFKESFSSCSTLLGARNKLQENLYD